MKKNFKGHANEGGVYKITNLINGKIYIGSAKRFKQRANEHVRSLKNNKHQNKHLQASFNKYGEGSCACGAGCAERTQCSHWVDTFIFEVLEVVEGDKLARTSREEELLKEQIELDNWENCFNFQKKPKSSERTCWSKSKDGFTEEHKIKISKALKNFYKDNPDKRNETANRLKNMKPIDSASKIYETNLLSPDGEKYIKIKNLSKFARDHDLNNQHLLDVIQGRRIHHRGWVLEENIKYLGITKIPMKNNTKEKISNASKGHNVSEETKQKISLALSGSKNPNFGKQMPTKTKKALLKATLGRKQTELTRKAIIKSRQKTYYISLQDPNGNVYGPITNLSKFCKNHNLQRSLLIKVIQGKRQHHKKWILFK